VNKIRVYDIEEERYNIYWKKAKENYNSGRTLVCLGKSTSSHKRRLIKI